MKKSLCMLVGSVSLFASVGHSAILTGSVDINPATSVTLTSDDVIDWAIWNTTSSTAVGSLSATNVQSGGAGLISAITAFSTVGATPNNVRGVGNAAALFSYTDGTSPATLSDTRQGFVANSTLATAGRGVQLSVSGATGQLYKVDVWTVGFAGQGEMRASLDGASQVTLFSEAFGPDGANKASNLFSFEFMPDTDTDLLSISFHLMSAGIGADAHVGIQAVTVTAMPSSVPEPSTGALLAGLGGLGFAALKRRRRA
ncbi:MAG: PEP-CTERM sorting domain-containing protein [Verrucomicrobiota bacterium]